MCGEQLGTLAPGPSAQGQWRAPRVEEGSPASADPVGRRIADCEALILLQTRGVLSNVEVLCDLAEAFQNQLVIVPISCSTFRRASGGTTSARRRRCASRCHTT